jgi:hypothetical protein
MPSRALQLDKTQGKHLFDLTRAANTSFATSRDSTD